MRTIYLLLAFSILLLFAGCIQQELYHKFERDGASALTIKYNFSQLIESSSQYGEQYGAPGGITEQEFGQQMEDNCTQAKIKNPSLECVVAGSILTMSLPFESDNPYYKFEAEEGLLSNSYRLTIKKIPLNEFDTGASLQNPNLAPPQALDLSNKTENARSAQSLGLIGGFVFTYTIEMPGSISEARAGNYSAIIEGNKATFDMVEVLGDSAPIEITAQELNIFFIIAIIAILLLIAVAFTFSKQKKR